MPDIPRSPYLFQLWGYVQAAVNDAELVGLGAKTQYIWRAYQERVLPELGPGAPPLTIRDVGQLTSLAYAQRNARAQLQAALRTAEQTGFDQAITPSMFASDLDTPTGAGLYRPNLARIRFGASITEGGIAVEQIRTYEPGLQGPQTVNEMRRMAADAAQVFAEKYGNEFEGLTGFFDLTMV